MAKHIETGERGEDEAVKYLEERGFEVLERRYRCLRTDIDIVARDGRDGSLRFVEVKSRNLRGVAGRESEWIGEGVGERVEREGIWDDFSPVAAVTPAKIERMLRAAEYYVRKTGERGEIGIDLITVTWKKEGVQNRREITYYPGII